MSQIGGKYAQSFLHDVMTQRQEFNFIYIDYLIPFYSIWRHQNDIKHFKTDGYIVYPYSNSQVCAYMEWFCKTKNEIKTE